MDVAEKRAGQVVKFVHDEEILLSDKQDEAVRKPNRDSGISTSSTKIVDFATLSSSL